MQNGSEFRHKHKQLKHSINKFTLTGVLGVDSCASGAGGAVQESYNKPKTNLPASSKDKEEEKDKPKVLSSFSCKNHNVVHMCLVYYIKYGLFSST